MAKEMNEEEREVYDKALALIEEAARDKRTVLSLSDMKLIELPPEIFTLTNLERLFLGSNQLTELPAEISKLTNLQGLYLYHNQLTTLPPEISKLTNLETLLLQCSQLTALPPEIGKLTNLQALSLQVNQLTVLPPEIGKLTNLQSLYLNDNQLTELPPEIGKLTNLENLDLDNNPLESPPPEIVKQGTEAVLGYLREKAKEMNIVTATNIFHPVGQGLFYSCQLSAENGKDQNFNFVFDCGSNSQKIIDREVELYCESLKHEDQPVIEMLFISHLHFDHVSGLKTLFNNAKVKRVFLPYLNPVERIRLATDSLEEHEWYYNFLENPLGFLGEYVEEIIFIVGSSGDSDYDDYPSENNDNVPRPNREEFSSENIFKNHLKKCEPEVVDGIGQTDPFLEIRGNNKVKFVRHFGSLIGLGIWEFKLFCYPVDKTKLDEFAKEIKKSGIAIDDLRRILRDKKERAKLAKAYKSLNSNINVSSLTVHHGCIVPHKYIADISCSPCNPNCLFPYYHLDDHPDFLLRCILGILNLNIKTGPFAGTLLLGDIKLEDSKKCKQFFDHYNSQLKHTLSVQLSHHGARNGWHLDLINKVDMPCNYICSSGRNSNDHPSRDVILDVINAKRCFIHVNEDNDLRQEIEIRFRRP